MSILNRLALKYLFLNKKRTLVTIFAVVLAGALMFSILSLSRSAEDIIDQDTINKAGNYHVVYYDTVVYSAKEYALQDGVKSTMLSTTKGFVEIPDGKSVGKPYITITALDQENFKNRPINLLEGRLPKNSNEIILYEYMLDVEKLPWKIGDTFTLDVGWRLITPYEQFLKEGGDMITDPYTYVSKDPREMWFQANDEKIVETQKMTFTLVGIMTASVMEDDSSPGFPAYTLLDPRTMNDDDQVDLSVLFKNKALAYELSESIANNLGISTRRGTYDMNYALLNLSQNLLTIMMGVHKGADLGGFFSAIVFLVVLLILVGSVSVIYNSFAISVSERKKQHGLLKSVGATPLQIRNSVYFEALAISVVGIPIGILMGYLGIGFILKMLAPSFADMMGSNLHFRVVVDPSLLLMSVLFIALVIMVSALIPAVRASRMAVMDVLRQTSDIKNRGRRSGTSRFFIRLFGFEATIALKNLRRNGRKYLTAIFSLVVSISIILAFVTFGNYAQKSAEAMFGSTTYDIGIQPINAQFGEKEDKLIMDYLSKSSTIKNFSRVTLMPTFDLMVKDGMLSARNAGTFKDLQSVRAFVYCLEDETFRRYAEQVGVDAGKFMDPMHPLSIHVEKNGGYVQSIRFAGKLLNLKVGDTVDLQIDAAYGTLAQLEIGALVDKLPIGLTTQRTEHIFVISDSVFNSVMQKFMDNYGQTFAQYYADVTDDATFQREFRALFGDGYVEDDFFIDSARAGRLREQAMNKIIGTFSIAYIIVICLIGVMNVYNTINTALELRRKEFFVLKSVGMAPKGLSRMLDSECIFFTMLALLFGVPVGIYASYFIYKAYSNIAEFGFSPPWVTVVAAAASVLIVVYMTMFFFKRRIRNESIIETIRQENT